MAKIVKLEVENIKKVKAVTVEPDPNGNLVVVAGPNGSGKSSVLDSIEAAIGGTKHAPADPIRHGAKKARIVLETEKLKVTRIWTAKGSRLEVTANGARVASPQTLLDDLTGSLTFDPLAFLRMKPKDQTELLRKLAGIDTSELEAKRDRVYQERRDIGRDLKRAQATLETLDRPDFDINETRSMSELVGEIEDREQQNAANRRDRDELDRLRNEALVLQKQLSVVREAGKKLAAKVAELCNQPTADLRAELKRAEYIVEARGKAEKYNATKYEVESLEGVYGDLERDLEHYRSEIAGAISAANYPIEGLEAGDEGVLFHNVPFEQASSAEQIRAGVAIGSALNPELRVMLIRDGSLLDERSLGLLSEAAAKHDLQLWIERVGADGRATVVLEDGEVADG